MMTTTPLATILPTEIMPLVLEHGVRCAHVTVSALKDTLVLTVTTAQLLDDVLADGLLADLAGIVTRAGIYQAVLDLRHVKAVCSDAIEMLMTFDRFLQEHGGGLRLCGLCPAVAEMVHVYAATEAERPDATLLEISPDLPAALRGLRQER